MGKGGRAKWDKGESWCDDVSMFSPNSVLYTCKLGTALLPLLSLFFFFFEEEEERG